MEEAAEYEAKKFIRENIRFSVAPTDAVKNEETENGPFATDPCYEK